MNEINKFLESHIREVAQKQEKFIESALRFELKKVFKTEIYEGVRIHELNTSSLQRFFRKMDIIVHQDGGELQRFEPLLKNDFEYTIEYKITPVTIKIYKRMV